VIFAVPTREYPAHFHRIIDKVRQTSIWTDHADHVAVLALQVLQGRECLGIDPERNRLIGPGRPPKYVLGFSHGK
jgi:hypothetical protein